MNRSNNSISYSSKYLFLTIVGIKEMNRSKNLGIWMVTTVLRYYGSFLLNAWHLSVWGGGTATANNYIVSFKKDTMFLGCLNG